MRQWSINAPRIQKCVKDLKLRQVSWNAPTPNSPQFASIKTTRTTISECSDSHPALCSTHKTCVRQRKVSVSNRTVRGKQWLSGNPTCPERSCKRGIPGGRICPFWKNFSNFRFESFRKNWKLNLLTNFYAKKKPKNLRGSHELFSFSG